MTIQDPMSDDSSILTVAGWEWVAPLTTSCTSDGALSLKGISSVTAEDHTSLEIVIAALGSPMLWLSWVATVLDCTDKQIVSLLICWANNLGKIQPQKQSADMTVIQV